jgi:hypothetical protein
MAPQRKPLALLGNRTAPEPEPVPQAVVPVAPAPATAVSRQANREGKRAVTVYVDQPVWEELRNLSTRLSRPGARVTTQDLMEHAMNLLFQDKQVPSPFSSR